MAEVPRGHDKPILVFAGTTRQARDWIVARGISPAWVEIITPNQLNTATRGAFGNPHVILGGWLSGEEIQKIHELIAVIMSPPWEDVDDHRLCLSGGHGPADVG